MALDSENQIILETVKLFFDSWSSKKFDEHPVSCHQEALFFVKINEVPPRPLSFIKSLPEFVGVQLKEIKQINVSGKNIASVLIDYVMTENDEVKSHVVGQHTSFLNMIKIDGVWTISGIVDYGVEV